MGMEIAVEKQLLLMVQVQEKLPCCIDGRLVEERRVFVEAVEVAALSVRSVVTSVNAIWVQHGNQNKDKVVT